jgi:superfamily II DNA or RNA helicase
LVHRSPFADPDQPPLLLHDAEGMPGYLGVPREWGLARYRHLPLEDRTTEGAAIYAPKRPDPNHPRVRNPEAQARFMADLLGAYDQHRSYIGMAPTGSGKTTCALNTAAELGRRFLVLVHLERLMDQWVEEIESKLGIPRNRIGIIQQDRCEWRDRFACVGLLHSVCRRQYEPRFYEGFGLVIYDEVHKIGSQFFAPAVSKFPSRYRLGLSATPERSDGGDRVFFYHLGPIRVTSAAEALPMRVVTVDYDCGTYPLWGDIPGARVKCLTKDQKRNQLLARLVRKLYADGRQALIVSDSVLHLQSLMGMAEQLGVPRSKMGQYTAEVHHAERSPLGEVKIVKRKQSKEALDRVKAESQLVFATYGMMTEGVDIPRLDAGIDATPKGKATQLIGRIRRPVPGKPRPVWITVRDIRCSHSRRWYQQRCRDYLSTGAEVVEHGAQKSGTV